MTPEKLPSLVDVGVILTGQSSSNISVTLRRLFQAYADLTAKCSQVNFGASGGAIVPVSCPKTSQGHMPLGGDLSLIGEVEHLNHVICSQASPQRGHSR